MSYLRPTRLAVANFISEDSSSDSGEDKAAIATQQPGSPALPGGIKVPVVASDLNEVSQEQYNLELSEAISLGFSIAKLSESGQHDVLIFQVARYRDFVYEGENYRFGVAIEATITVATEKFQGGLTLPSVAANVQLGIATASSRLAVRGYGNDPQNPILLPAWGSFDVGSYTEFQNTVSDLQKKILFNDNFIRPVLLATTQPAPAANQDKKPPHGFWYKLGQRVEQV